jgi:ATP-binding cassette subfamily B protein
MGNESISDKEIDDALAIVNMAKFVSKLPKGLDSRLSSAFVDGVQISGGQEQRLFIARALLRQADFLVLDEPTSAIDARTEHTIFNELFNQKVERSTLIISHRFSTVRKASKILVLDKGEIVENGTHEELMKNDGIYFELFSKQAEGYK